MAVRSSMAQLIARTRLLIGDPVSGSSQFLDQDLQDSLDETRDDVRYEMLTAAPTIVNSAGTGNVASTFWADYYSRFQWWESDVVLLGNTSPVGPPWVVLTPLSSDYITGHWMFDSLTPFTTGTIPGQFPPVFAVGKVYDLNRACANLLDIWAGTVTRAYTFTSDGQQFQREQMYQMMQKQAKAFRAKAKPLITPHRVTRSWCRC
jgi:hypothetical protein